MSKSTRNTDNLQFVIQPSQWVNIGWLILTCVSAVLFYEWAVIPGLIWFWNCMVISCWKFQIHEMTITERKGVFTVHKREVHFYRIKSIRVEEPFLYRLVKIYNIDLITSDPFIPVLRLYAIENGNKIREYIKEMTRYWRNEMGVREYDLR